MAKLRSAVLAVALATGGVGCATFCDECDDFPIPGGPGGYAMMPGSYAGGPLSSAPDTPPTGSPMLGSGPTSPGRPATSAPASEAVPTPPTPPAASPGQDAGAPPTQPNGANVMPLPTDRVAISSFSSPVLPSSFPR